MSIQPVQENKSYLGDGIKSALIGGTMGYVSKYALPLTAQEKDVDYQKIVETIKRNATNAKKAFVRSIKDVETRTLSQDTYIKLTDKVAKNNINIYNSLLKKARPTMPFVGTGIGIGLLVSFIKSTFSTEIN